MSAATLLNANDPAFNFDHQQSHFGMLITEAGAGASLNFSVFPYLIDPSFGDTEVQAGWSNTLHAQAHSDFIGLFPAPFGGSGVASLNDVALNPETSAWWQFSNFQLHYVANQLF